MMHAGEVETDAAMVRRLLASQFPAWADLPVERVASETATDHAIYRLGARLAVRLPRIKAATGQADLEERWLPVLAPLLPLAIPMPVARGVPGEGYPWDWSIVTWLDGESAEACDFNLLQAADDLARFVRALHGVELADGPLSVRAQPLEARDAGVRDLLAKLGNSVDAASLAEVWDAAVAAPPWDGPTCWVHGDLLPGNLVLPEGRLSGVIDFGCMGLGDPALDLTPAWYLFTGESREVFRAAVDLDAATWARARGWIVLAIFGLVYYADSSPAIVARCRYVLEQVVEEFRSPALRRGR